jgi:enoyl-CoA hydratase
VEFEAVRAQVSGSDVLYAVEGDVGVITINRTYAANSLTAEALSLLAEYAAAADHDNRVRALVLTSAGDGPFCAGADLERLFPALRADGTLGKVVPDSGKRFFSEVRKPMIGAIHGPCIGGGVELALGCDIRVCDEGASFALAEVRWGLVPVGGGTVRLPAQIPYAIAMEMLLTGRPLSAERAERCGLVNYVVRRDDLMDTALKIARMIAANSPRAVEASKHLARQSTEPRQYFHAEYEIANDMLRGSDALEGVAAFRERREPRYSSAVCGAGSTTQD